MEPKKVAIIFEGRLIRYKCPKCNNVLQFHNKHLGKSICQKCGQRLDWSQMEEMCSVTIQANDSDEAAWIAKQYYEINGMKEEDWIDIDELRHSLRGEGCECYLLFKSTKAKGKFMRRYAREASVPDG